METDVSSGQRDLDFVIRFQQVVEVSLKQHDLTGLKLTMIFAMILGLGSNAFSDKVDSLRKKGIVK
ncbi:hypothetical protein Hanom_Chr10g00903531 [Helianthus anomalus]